MKITDHSANPLIAILNEMPQRIEASKSPFDAFRTVLDGLTAVFGSMTCLHLSTLGLATGQYRVVLLRIPEAGVDSLADAWAADELHIHEGGVIGEVIENRQPQIAHDVDWSADPYFRESLHSFRSLLAVPINTEDLPVNWVMMLRKEPDGFTPEHLAAVMLRASLVASMMNSRQLVQRLRLANAHINREVERVGQILQCLLPEPLPKIPGLQIAARFETFAQAGGDLYDLVKLNEQTDGNARWGIFIADASGHGPAAAVVIAVVQAVLRARPLMSSGPAELLERINVHLCERPIARSFVTAFLAVYESNTRQLTYAGAGHPLPLHRTCRGGTSQLLQLESGFPLGIDESQSFMQSSINLDSGDSLLFYTDGISEARNADGGMFEAEGIQQTLNTCGAGAHEIVDAVQQAVTAYSGGVPASDDRTLLAISVL